MRSFPIVIFHPLLRKGSLQKRKGYKITIRPWKFYGFQGLCIKHQGEKLPDRADFRIRAPLTPSTLPQPYAHDPCLHNSWPRRIEYPPGSQHLSPEGGIDNGSFCAG